MSLQAKDKLFLALGGFALVLTTAWVYLEQSKVAAIQTARSVPTSGNEYVKKDIKVAMPPSKTWAKAEAQPAGDKWIYSVFTSPKIYYNTATKQFTVIPPELIKRDVPTVDLGPPPPKKADLELVKVDQPLFRLQLVGYVGGEGSYRGTFNNEQTGKTFFAVSGHKVTDLNLEITKFEAKRIRNVGPTGAITIDMVANATVKDTITNKVYQLELNKRLADGQPVATFKLADGTEKTLASGSSIKVGDYSYAVGAINFNPPSVAVTKIGASLAKPETETLTVPVVAPSAPDNSGAAGASQAPAVFPVQF